MKIKIKFNNKDDIMWVMDEFLDRIFDKRFYKSNSVRKAQSIYDDIMNQIGE